MDLGDLTGSGIFEEEEEERRSYSIHFRPKASREDAARQRHKKARHVYQTFVEPVLEEIDETFTPEEVREEIRPPYSEKEIEAALEYAVDEEGLGYESGEELFSSG
jgi:hypothetical protein